MHSESFLVCFVTSFLNFGTYIPSISDIFFNIKSFGRSLFYLQVRIAFMLMSSPSPMIKKSNI